METWRIAELILNQAGLVSFVLFMGNVGLAYLYLSERADRRAAWKAYNELAEKTNKTLTDMTLVMQGIKDRL